MTHQARAKSQPIAQVSPIPTSAAGKERREFVSVRSYMADLCQVADDESCFFLRMGELALERIAHA